MSYSSISGHKSMVFDEHRNDLYARAMRKWITQETVVLDLGAGLGILGLMAAKMGARRVYMVEPTETIRVAGMLAKANGLQDCVQCFEGQIEEVKLREKVDLIISVFTGNFLLEEDLLPSLFYARDHYLKPGGQLLPDFASMEVMPVVLEGEFKKNIVDWATPNQGIDFSLVRKYAANNLYYDNYSERGYTRLSEPGRLLELDFTSTKQAACDGRVKFIITQHGWCHGFLGWFTARLGDDWLSTAPDAKPTHWRQAFLPLDPPLELQQGEELEFSLQRPEFGQWSWESVHLGKRQKHSTFLASPLTSADLAKKSSTHTARLSDQGKVALRVMELFDGCHSAEDIAQQISRQYPQVFSSLKQAERLVQNLIRRYA